MLWKTRELKEFSLRARDGEIGTVTDIYIDDARWALRYLVVSTGSWLERREVLVSPLAFELPLNAPAKVIPVRITRDQVKNAPPVDTKKPVSRHYETLYYNHFGWPYYWAAGAGSGPLVAPPDLPRASANGIPPASAPEQPHLRSANEVKGYHFEGRDGKLGHVEDFILSDEDWSVRYLEIDTRNWWPGGKKVLLAVDSVEDVAWAECKLTADVPRDTVKRAPEYDDSLPITDEYERALATYYSRSIESVR